MSVRMRHTHEHTANRRSHHALKEPRLSTCDKCGAKHVRHTMCNECGVYKGREVVDVAQAQAKKAERIARKQREMGAETGAVNASEEANSEKEAKQDKKALARKSDNNDGKSTEEVEITEKSTGK